MQSCLLHQVIVRNLSARVSQLGSVSLIRHRDGFIRPCTVLAPVSMDLSNILSTRVDFKITISIMSC